MPAKKSDRMYRDLAWTWPIISPPEDYRSEAALFADAIRDNSPLPARTLLDLGCGGGHNDFHLKRRFDVTGVDISPGMLANARKLNPEVRYAEGDIRSVRLDREFDAAVMADSVMYMLSEGDMLAAFRTAFEHLRPGGVFCTYSEESPETFKGETYTHPPRKAGSVEITLIEHKWDPDPADCTFQLLFIYIIRDGSAVRVETDRHTCGLFPKKAWRHLLSEAGFKVKATRGTEEGMLTFYACVKPRPRAPSR